jgi:hypothetical protein
MYSAIAAFISSQVGKLQYILLTSFFNAILYNIKI